ncbi:hypothetical protein [Parvibaculum sp.]|jgi:hypothetical protein
MSRRSRKLLTFAAVALTVAAIITLAQSRFPPEPGPDGEQRALLVPDPR